MSARRIVEVPVLSAALRDMNVPLSPVTAGGGLVFVSGMPPLDLDSGKLREGDIATQTKACLEALLYCLTAAGSRAENVLMIRVYAANAGHYDTINRVYAQFFPVDPPARTFVPVASWPKPFDLEIDCTALGPAAQ